METIVLLMRNGLLCEEIFIVFSFKWENLAGTMLYKKQASF